MKAMTPPSASLNLATPAHTPVTSAAKTPQTNSKPSSSASTPSSNNNYAAPHTPIASAKRPRNNTTGRKSRSSIGTSQHTYGREIVRNHDNNGNSASHSNHKSKQEPLDVTPVRKMRLSEGGDNENKQMNRMQMSPMHKARPAVENDQKNESESDTAKNKWVGIFSPVLNFLNHSTENNNHGHGENDPSMEEKIVTENGNDIEHDVDGDVKMEGEIQYDTDSPTSDASFSITYSNSMASIDDYGVPEEDAESIQEYNVEVNVEEEDDEEEDEFNPYLFMRFLPPYEIVVPHPEHKICLPPKDKADPPITLVLDLDETLVHCTVEPIADASMVFPVFFNGIQYSVHVRTRPFLQEFLESVSKSFEVVVFTASQKVYADELLNRIDPDGKYIKHRMFRESCLLVEGNYLKDLNVLGRDLSSSVLVDNSPHAFGYQVDNGIPIESWFEDPNDVELIKLDQFLKTLHGVKDVRSVVRSKFQTYKLIRDAK